MVLENNLREAIKKSLIEHIAYYKDENNKLYIFLNGDIKVKFN